MCAGGDKPWAPPQGLSLFKYLNSCSFRYQIPYILAREWSMSCHSKTGIDRCIVLFSRCCMSAPGSPRIPPPWFQLPLIIAERPGASIFGVSPVLFSDHGLSIRSTGYGHGRYIASFVHLHTGDCGATARETFDRTWVGLGQNSIGALQERNLPLAKKVPRRSNVWVL